VHHGVKIVSRVLIYDNSLDNATGPEAALDPATLDPAPTSRRLQHQVGSGSCRGDDGDAAGAG
jgi:hypothetical protein